MDLNWIKSAFYNSRGASVRFTTSRAIPWDL